MNKSIFIGVSAFFIFFFGVFSIAFALPPFGGPIIGTLPCVVSGLPALWISVGPPRPIAGFVLPPPATLQHLYFKFIPGTEVIGNTSVPVVGTCATPTPPFVIKLPGFIISTIGTSL